MGLHPALRPKDQASAFLQGGGAALVKIGDAPAPWPRWICDPTSWIFDPTSQPFDAGGRGVFLVSRGGGRFPLQVRVNGSLWRWFGRSGSQSEGDIADLAEAGPGRPCRLCHHLAGDLAVFCAILQARLRMIWTRRSAATSSENRSRAVTRALRARSFRSAPSCQRREMASAISSTSKGATRIPSCPS